MLCAVLGVSLGLGPAHAGPDGRNNYYKYVDDNGVTHITNIKRKASGWTLYKSLPGSGGGDGQTRRAVPRRPPVKLDEARIHRYDSIIRAAARRYQLPASLVRAVIHTESNYNANAVSRVGAMGLMQLMPSTARYLGVPRPFDPHQNVHGGTRLLRMLANRYAGDMTLVLAAYNAGAGNVEKYGGIPPFSETRSYVRSVLRRYYAYERQAQVAGGGRRRGPARHIAR